VAGREGEALRSSRDGRSQRPGLPSAARVLRWWADRPEPPTGTASRNKAPAMPCRRDGDGHGCHRCATHRVRVISLDRVILPGACEAPQRNPILPASSRPCRSQPPDKALHCQRQGQRPARGRTAGRPGQAAIRLEYGSDLSAVRTFDHRSTRGVASLTAVEPQDNRLRGQLARVFNSSRIGHSGRSLPLQRRASSAMVLRIAVSSLSFRSSSATCLSARRLTSRLARRSLL
jgi:hypothetical protein